jgi:hypothetical protein
VLKILEKVDGIYNLEYFNTLFSLTTILEKKGDYKGAKEGY